MVADSGSAPAARRDASRHAGPMSAHGRLARSVSPCAVAASSPRSKRTARFAEPSGHDACALAVCGPSSRLSPPVASDTHLHEHDRKEAMTRTLAGWRPQHRVLASSGGPIVHRVGFGCGSSSRRPGFGDGRGSRQPGFETAGVRDSLGSRRWSVAGNQFFTPPAVRPEMMRRWKSRTMMTNGTVTRVPAAMIAA